MPCPVEDIVVWCRAGNGSGGGEVDKLVENIKLELKLDRIGHALVGGLELVEIGILEAKNGSIEEYDDDVDEYEVPEDVRAVRFCVDN